MSSLVQNDQGIILNFTITDENNSPVDLTGATVRLIWNNGSGAATKTCEVTDAAGGKCRYIIVAGDIAQVGKYDCELEVNLGAAILTTNKFNFKVRSEL
jgi:hypothetical protein